MGGIFTGVHDAPPKRPWWQWCMPVFSRWWSIAQLSCAIATVSCVQHGQLDAGDHAHHRRRDAPRLHRHGEQMGPKLMHVFLSFSSDP